MTPRNRRRLVFVVLVAAGVAVVTTYRGRTLRRNASEFVERYGD
jgi:hypothetical protein